MLATIRSRTGLTLAASLLVFCATGCTGLDAHAAAGSADDREAVRRAALDYVEALYDAEPDRIRRSVHPDLKKYGFYRPADADVYRGSAMTFAQLVELAGSWNRDGSKTTADSPKQVEVLDVLDQTAAAKVTAEWGVDYMQLARFDGEWKILHIVWQSHPSR
jgi:hypothetical protein